MPDLSPAVIQKLGPRWEAGEALSVLAKSVGVSWQVLSTTLVHAGFHPRRTIKKVSGKTSLVGHVINYRGFVYGPVGEQGVVSLFAKLSDELGFIIEEIKEGFPDCIARRQVKKGLEHVRIEFEFKSSNFELHGHDPAGCDLIICWEHDWETCPLPVLSLKTHIANSRDTGGPSRTPIQPVETRKATITEGGIRNGYIKLRPIDEFWPADCIGDGVSARRHLTVELEGIGRVTTDITKRHKEFRSARREIKEFAKKHRLKHGDQVEIIRLGLYEYRIRPAKSR